jgi:hypothetical protein
MLVSLPGIHHAALKFLNGLTSGHRLIPEEHQVKTIEG